ncbi:MAG: NTP transferase domain-containing protein [Deltaproteobacteria bacterium]|jgi:phosphoenolpyruvate phosphomutase|nr:NTP transferase domain-containing protein [Deltaproteobacteria bacterium]
MLALLLNSGLGSRMGESSASRPKCLTPLASGETILGRQMRLLLSAGVDSFVITTGPFPDLIENEVATVAPTAKVIYVPNPLYQTTNYIYSIYLAKDHLVHDMLLLHGDLVFDEKLLPETLKSAASVVTVFPEVSTMNKDFKALTDGTKVTAIGTALFENSVSLQPLYLLRLNDWRVWLGEIERFVAGGKVTVYAENAFNEISSHCALLPLPVLGERCLEIDDQNDLARANLLISRWETGQ